MPESSHRCLSIFRKVRAPRPHRYEPRQDDTSPTGLRTKASRSVHPPAIMVTMVEYTYLVLRLPRGTTRDAARRVLTEHAEHGGWEIDRLRLYPDGSRRIQLRRKIIRQVRTF